MLERWLRLALFLALGASVGCDDAPQPPAPPIEDRALECVPDGEEPEGGAGMDGGQSLQCAGGEVCILGRCYAQCMEGGDDCGPREECRNGVCVRRVGPQPDAGGRMDAGEVRPCDGVMCTDPEVCHPRSGQCGQCSEDTVGAMAGEPGACDGLEPVCDIANGACVVQMAAQCAPCNDDMDCATMDMSFVGTCVTRDIMGWREQVCLQTCDAMTPCAPGLDCVGGQCEPPSGASCTTWRRAVDRNTCLGDGDCNIANTAGQPIFFVDVCEGETVPAPPDAGMGEAGVPDGGAPTPGVCVQPCGSDEECFNQAGGQMCLDTGGGLRFCIIP